MIVAVKVFRIKMPSPGGVPEAAPFAVTMETPDAQDPERRQQLSGVVQEAASMGFHSPVYFSTPQSLQEESRVIGVLLLGATSEAIANSICGLSSGNTRQVTSILSWLSDDTFLVTDNGAPGMKRSPRFRAQTSRDASFGELDRLHRNRLRNLATTGISMKPIRTIEQAGAFQEEIDRESIRWHVSRGVYVEMTSEQIAEARKQAGCAMPTVELQPQISMRIDGVSTSGASANALALLIWTLGIQDESGNSSVTLDAGIPGGNIVVGQTYTGSIGASVGSNGHAFVQAVRRLLQSSPDMPNPEIPYRRVPLTMEFLGYTTELAKPGQQVIIGRTVNIWAHFQLVLEAVPGNLYLQLSETGKEAVLHTMPDLDRTAAFEKLAGLFAG